jgi:hypothetical protein
MGSYVFGKCTRDLLEHPPFNVNACALHQLSPGAKF